MLQQDQPEDYVISTGKQYSVRQFIEWSAAELGMKIEWRGKGVDEKGYWINRVSSRTSNSTYHVSPIVSIDPRYFRPSEVETLLGDSTKAKTMLGWLPEITAQAMCREMVAHDLEQAKQSALLMQHGFAVNVGVE